LERAPNGPHTGEHRATFTILGVGKVMYKWKVKPHQFKPPKPMRGRRSDELLG
jgi:hypothetical protein